MSSTFNYSIPTIPDANHFRYRQIAHGDVRQQLFERAEQLLRVVSRFKPGELTLTLRATFDPAAVTLQDRLRWSLQLYAGDSFSRESVTALVENGPLGGFYDFSLVNSMEADYSGYSVACEVLRFEETIKPLVPKDFNSLIDFKHYYAVKPFSPREDNDWLLLDQTLSGVAEPLMFEMTVSPTDPAEVRSTHFEWVNRLLSINAYDNDVYVPGQQQSSAAQKKFGQQGSYIPQEKSRRYKDPLADEFLRENQDLFGNLRKEQLRFALRVFAVKPETCQAVASTVAESCFAEGLYQIIPCHRGEPAFARAVEESGNGGWGDDPYDPAVFFGAPDRKNLILHRLARMATADELKGAFRLPVAAGRSPQCMRKSTDPVIPPATESILFGYDLEMGIEPTQVESHSLVDILDRGDNLVPPARLPLELLKKHLFIAGASGSGKTTAVFNLLVQLYRQGIPFLVIEPAKTEYRILKTLTDHTDPDVRRLAQDLRIYTPGNEELAPFRLNPLAYPSHVSRDEHISQLMSCFKAGMPLFGPLEAVITDSIEEVYRQVPEGQEFPTMGDLFRIVREIMESKGYAGEVQANLRAAIEVRLGALTKRSIGKIFDTEQSTPGVMELLGKPTIIEMEYLGSDHACLLTLFILAALRAEIRNRPSGSPLMHIIVLEEAHNIVGKPGDGGGEESVDPKAQAAEYISRMLAELRALGEGIVIADQLPSAVAPEVVKNTGTKLAGRLVAQDDREFLGATMLLDGEQMIEMARLAVGEAYLYHEDLHAPRRCQALNTHRYLDLERRPFPKGADLLKLISGDDWYQAALGQQVEQCQSALAALQVVVENTAAIFKTLDGNKGKYEEGYKTEIIDKNLTLLEREYTIFFHEIFSPLYERIAAQGPDALRKKLEEIDDAINLWVNPQIDQLQNLADEISKCE